MPIPNSKILKDDVIPKPVRAEEPAVPSSEVETKHPSPLPVIAILLIVVALAPICLGQNSPSTVPSNAKTDAPKPIPFLTPLPQDTGLPGLKQQLRKLQTTGRLMMVVAHPDDEDGGTLTLEARGKGVQTLLFTLTRGEGGQNELGTGLFDKLGILRTLELLASDKYYGVEQRFSRVADFGYSKTPEETFQKWGGHDVPLADIVRVIRTFRPDVLVARFSGTDNDGHGHHQASAILTREAFRAAADPNRFPEQIEAGLRPWQAKKLYIGNVCGFRSNTCADENWTVKLDAGEVDPVLGMSYAQMAADGLAHQRSQGHNEYKVSPGPHNSFYKLVDSVLPNTKDAIGHEKDFFDGIDTSLPELATRLGDDEEKVPWLRPELLKISNEVKQADGQSNVSASSAAGPLFLSASDLHDVDTKIGKSALSGATKRLLWDVVREKQKQVGSAINQAMNVTLEASFALLDGSKPYSSTKDNPAISPGQKFKIKLTLHNGSGSPIFLTESFAGWPGWFSETNMYWAELAIQPNASASVTIKKELLNGLNIPASRPYWHREDPEEQSINHIDDPMFVTKPFALWQPEIHVAYRRGKQKPKEDWENRGAEIDAAVAGASGRTPAIVPTFSVALEPGEQVLPVADGKEPTVKVGVSSNLTGAPAGTLHLDLPSGWRAEPDSLKVSLPKRGDQQDFTFKVFPANLKEGRSEIRAVLDAGGTKYSEGYTLVTREDLGSAYYFQPAVQRVSIVDVKIPKDLKLGYILGAGDDIPTVLEQIGMNVTIIPAEKIATENLAQYGTIVLGVRAYDAQKDVVANSQKLLDYVFNGGTLVVQHNNDTGAFNSAHFTPYPATLGRTRVSVEEAPVTILAPNNQVFHYPNEISQEDFDGWVQERGLYFMDKWDDHFTPLMSCHDPNEPDAKGGLLYAKYGKGVYIYSGYAFYRQLPAGVSGAIRLFVNMVSADSSH
jgi:LmbE family N-acetylglucosaminyl deacetylase